LPTKKIEALIYFPRNKEIYIGLYHPFTKVSIINGARISEIAWGWDCSRETGETDEDITHWMLLPEPPKDKEYVVSNVDTNHEVCACSTIMKCGKHEME